MNNHVNGDAEHPAEYHGYELVGLRRVTELNLPPAASKWQPIETAPKGDVLLLCWRGLDGDWSMHTGYWSDAGRKGWTTGAMWLDYMTHWMLLPLPPPTRIGSESAEENRIITAAAGSAGASCSDGSKVQADSLPSQPPWCEDHDLPHVYGSPACKRDWARAFCKIAKETGHGDLDEGWMTSWFANALMRGYDEGRSVGKTDRNELSDRTGA